MNFHSRYFVTDSVSYLGCKFKTIIVLIAFILNPCHIMTYYAYLTNSLEDMHLVYLYEIYKRYIEQKHKRKKKKNNCYVREISQQQSTILPHSYPYCVYTFNSDKYKFSVILSAGLYNMPTASL